MKTRLEFEELVTHVGLIWTQFEHDLLELIDVLLDTATVCHSEFVQLEF